MLVKVSVGQELYPYSEPASNMPARSVGLKLSSMFSKGVHSNAIIQRHMPELMLGINKKWMVHLSGTVSNMHKGKFIGESVRVYSKYRFLSVDGVHKHFRMAAFGTAAYSRNHLDHNEINLMGDQSGVQAGLIATQLWNKLAISGTASLAEIINKERWKEEAIQPYVWRAFFYSVSAGYLLFPLEYKSYKQTNVNLYAEVLGSRNINWPQERFYIDVAPSVQFIFNSTGKLNLGYRFQVAGDIYRLMDRSFTISYEHLLLNALPKRKRA